MGQAKLGKHPVDTIEIEPAEKRLAEDLKRALETKSSRHGNAPKREKAAGKWPPDAQKQKAPRAG